MKIETKITLIKMVRSLIDGMSLLDAKLFVEAFIDTCGLDNGDTMTDKEMVGFAKAINYIASGKYIVKNGKLYGWSEIHYSDITQAKYLD